MKHAPFINSFLFICTISFFPIISDVEVPEKEITSSDNQSDNQDEIRQKCLEIDEKLSILEEEKTIKIGILESTTATYQYFADNSNPETSTWPKRNKEVQMFVQQELAKGITRREISSRLSWQSDMGKESSREYWQWQRTSRKLEPALEPLYRNNCFDRHNQVIPSDLCKMLDADFKEALLAYDTAEAIYKHTPEYFTADLLNHLDLIDGQIQEYSKERDLLQSYLAQSEQKNK